MGTKLGIEWELLKKLELYPIELAVDAHILFHYTLTITYTMWTRDSAWIGGEKATPSYNCFFFLTKSLFSQRVAKFAFIDRGDDA